MPKAKSQKDMGYGETVPAFQLPNDFSVLYFRDYNFKASLPHLHPDFEFMLILHGDVKVAADATLYSVPTGSVIIMPPNLVHCTILDNTEMLYERQILHLTSSYIDLFHEKNDFIRIFSTPIVINCSIKDTVEFRDLLEKIMTEDKNLHSGDSFARSMITMFLLKCARKLEESPSQRVSNTSILVDRLIRYIEEHFTEPELSLENLTAQAYVSKGHLNRLFKAYTGVSLYKYVIQRRLIYSTELLQRGFSVLSAGLESGFEDYTCFLKAFKKTYGMTPRNYCTLKAQQGRQTGFLAERFF